MSVIESRKDRNYYRYIQAPFHHPEHYPLKQRLPPDVYRPVAPWVGCLILPSLRQRNDGDSVLFKVYHAPPAAQQLVGQVVELTWNDDPAVQAWVQAVRRDVQFPETTRNSVRDGIVHPQRLNGWQQVGPLESLAGARRQDNMMVRLDGPVAVDASEERRTPRLLIAQTPVQITGRYYALVTFVRPFQRGGEEYRVRHYSRASRDFSGLQEVVRLPHVMTSETDSIPATNTGIETSPANAQGWYIYGAQDSSGVFVVQALAPRALLRLEPSRVVKGRNAAASYVQQTSWDKLEERKGQVSTIFLAGDDGEQAQHTWATGERALVLHVSGGIGGAKGDPEVQRGRLPGHFACGIAQVVDEPLSGERCFDIVYHQLLAHNSSGIVAGTHAWSSYMGDRQWGLLGTRPAVDVLIKLDALTVPYTGDGVSAAPLDELARLLETMAARYRIGDGTGRALVGRVSNATRDATTACYSMTRRVQQALSQNMPLEVWMRQNAVQAERLKHLVQFGTVAQPQRVPFGTPPREWQPADPLAGTRQQAETWRDVLQRAHTWRTMLPRVASNTLAQAALKQGATAWVLRVNQVGGEQPDISPLAPMSLFNA